MLAATLVAVQVLSPILAAAQSASNELIPQADLALGFNPNSIIDDRDMFEVERMNLQSLRSFLRARGTLGRIKIKDIDGQEKEPAEIIWRVATSYSMNPQYLLVLLQKEQSLVEDPNPSQKQFDWATGYGVCDSCSKDDPRIQDFKGFANQLEYAAKQHRERYLMQLLTKGTTLSGHAANKTVKINGMDVTPANNATAMLYTYTPHIHGNLNLWRIWRRWFSLNFPDGTVVQGKTTGQIYLLRFGVKRPFKNKMVASSMVDPSKVVMVEDSQLSAYPDGPTISFPNYAIVETEDGKRYLIDGQSKRLIVSTAVYRKLGFTEDDIIEGSTADLASYESGRDIESEKQYPTGLLGQGPNGGVWFIQDGVRHPITDATVFKLYFKGRKPKPMTDAELEAYEKGAAYQFRNGELVRAASKPDVYVVEHGVLRPILSGDVFEQLGWQWHNIVTVPDRVLRDYTIGSPVELQSAPRLIDPETTIATNL